MKNKIKQLLDSSKDVILDCTLENGGIVAANSSKEYYSKDAKNYFYVWPRDGAYNCMAADVVGINYIQEKFFTWLSDRAEGWEETGLFYEKYYPNGLKESGRCQIDQTGIIIFSIYKHFENNPKDAEKYKKLVVNSADAICENWDKDHFKLIINDLWEERLTFPDSKENFSYSLATCIAGLLAASKLFPDKKYVDTSDEIKKSLLENIQKQGYVSRSFGKINDERIDASALGLIWPFEIIKPNDVLVKNTIKKIEKKLVKNFGVYRYENDEYDGWMFDTNHRKKGAGYWALLNFWMSIVLCKMNRKEEAERYYFKVIDSIEGLHIPEQFFSNKIQKSVSPLCWSHSMFIFASKELGYL